MIDSGENNLPVKVLLNFPHGLGDAVQGTILVKHLQHYYPNWKISIITKPGRESIFYGITENSWRWLHPHYWKFPECKWDIEKYVCFSMPYSNYPQYPSNSKIAQCLTEEFQLEPIPELYKYTIVEEPITPEIESYINSIPKPFALIHTYSEETDRDKNLTDPETDCLIERVKAKGLFPVVIDFSHQMINRRKDLFLINSIKPSPFDRWGNPQHFRHIIKKATAYYGIDSGPAHLAATTEIPITLFWRRGTNPYYCFEPLGNVLHYVPDYWQTQFFEEGKEQAIQRFRELYQFHEYDSLPEVINMI